MHKPVYLTYSDYGPGYGLGQVYNEARPDETFDDIVDYIMSGEREHVVRVYCIAPDRPPQDVSWLVADTIADRIAKGEPCSRSASRYLAEYGLWTPELEAAE